MSATHTATPSRLRRLPQIFFHALSATCAAASLAALTLSVILFTSRSRPTATIDEVSQWNQRSVTVLFTCLGACAILMGVLYLTARARPDAPAPKEGGWSRAITVLVGATFIWMLVSMFPLPSAVSKIEGEWRTSGRFSGHQTVSEPEAQEMLWQNIRFYAVPLAIGLLLLARLAQLMAAVTGATATSTATSGATVSHGNASHHG